MVESFQKFAFFVEIFRWGDDVYPEMLAEPGLKICYPWYWKYVFFSNSAKFFLPKFFLLIVLHIV